MIKISLPVKLLLAIVGVVLFGSYVPIWGVEACYTVSVLFKDALSLLLPFMIFSFVYCGVRSFEENAPVILGILLVVIFASNFAGAFISYVVARNILPGILQDASIHHVVSMHNIEPFFRLPISMPIPLSWALIASIILAIVSSFVDISRFDRGVHQVKTIIKNILTYVFIPMLPIYVLGFLLKMQCESAFGDLFNYYGRVMLLIVGLQGVYLLLLYALAKGFSVRKTSRAIKNAIPSYLAAFTSMSSMVALPVSIQTAKRNVHNKPLVNMAMPILANIHLLGAAVTLPILAIATMILFKGYMPGLAEYSLFTVYLCTTMFAVSGVPGAGIITLILLLITQFGFSVEMVSIVTTLYLLMEAFGTAMNAMGDGALVIIVNKILRRFGFAE